jgi:outer membrane receptor protein involved in Fe transport
VPDDAFEQQYNGQSLLPGAYIPIGRAQSETVSSDNRAYEYIDISDLSNRSILRFNNIIESDITDADIIGGSWSDIKGVRDPSETAMWALNRTTESEVLRNSLWFAGQSEFFDGRLHTLIGLRYDHIKIDSAFRKVLYHGYDVGADIVTLDEDPDLTDQEKLDRQEARNNQSEIIYDQFNPTIGALFWATSNIGFFANYAQSIESPSGTDRTPTGEIAPPELGEGFEAGIRFDLLEGKLDGQIALYRIIKENDSEFAYSDSLLRSIYTFGRYGAEYPEIFNDNNSLVTSLLPGRRGIGDKTRSEGLEMDLTYNPMPGLSIIASYHYQIANEIEELHPLVENPSDFELFGRPDHRFTITGRYKFRDGALKGLTLGASQRFRSATPQTSFNLNYDANNIPTGDPDQIVRTDKVYLEFEDEHTTTIFATWSKKLGRKRSSPKLDLAFRVHNVFNNDEFTGRENYGFYRESRSYNLSGTIHF